MPSLPKTLQDAIWVTRKLGFRFLWVDALCIILDSTADKIAEIGRMGTICKNSSLTIAAARSLFARMGFLDALTVPSMFQLSFYLPDAELGTVFLEFDYIDTASVDLLSSRA